ncbi:hypothetical protein EDB85DRAFT_249319 [Lactarius pseudohatsudake]|nr:hypothetical protein EDB85DRAFT_249319 [Lactarius pseudohatsudake]
MPIRPLNTLTLEELVQLLNNPAFFECFEFAYDMYYLRQRFVRFTTTGEFAVYDPPVPVITPRNDPSFGGIAAPIADFGAPNAWSNAGPMSSDLMASMSTQAPPLPQQEANAMTWAQLTGMNGLVQGADGVAPFDVEAAPMAPGINVGQDQTLNSLTHDYNFTPAQAALPQLTDLAMSDSGMNDNWDSLLGTAIYSGATPSYDPLSPAEVTPMMSPVSSSSMGDAENSYSSLFSLDMSSEVNGESSDEHEESSSITTSDNNSPY